VTLNSVFIKDKDLPVLVKETFDLVAHLEKTYPGLHDHSLPDIKEVAWAQVARGVNEHG